MQKVFELLKNCLIVDGAVLVQSTETSEQPCGACALADTCGADALIHPCYVHGIPENRYYKLVGFLHDPHIGVQPGAALAEQKFIFTEL